MPITDLKLTKTPTGVYDLTVKNGNLEKHSGLDTALKVSILTDFRASVDQVIRPQDRRGWLGNIINKIQGRQLGGGVWLLNQRRLNQTTLNEAIDVFEKSLQWLIDDKLVVSLSVSGDIIPINGIQIQVDITVIEGQILTQYFKLWEMTGL